MKTFFNIISILYVFLACLLNVGIGMGLGMGGLENCVSSGKTAAMCNIEALLPPQIPFIICIIFFKYLWKPIRYLVLSYLSFFVIGPFLNMFDPYINAAPALMASVLFFVLFVVHTLEYCTSNGEDKKLEKKDKQVKLHKK